MPIPFITPASRITLALIGTALLLTGIIIGGYLFSKTQPRSFLNIQNCTQCLSRSELAGLVGSVVVNRAPIALAPVVVMETDKTVVVKKPSSEAATDYVVIPKKDIKDVGELSEADKDYLIDAYAVIERLIEKDKLHKYQVVTNGPGTQQVRYLHFHLVSIGQ